LADYNDTLFEKHQGNIKFMQEINHSDVTTILVEDILKEKRTERRWRNVRFIAWFALILYIVIRTFSFLDEGTTTPVSPMGHGKYAALVRLDGMIAPNRDYSAASLIPVLKEAFSDKTAAGVVIAINSPGGTPVQSAIIHDAILRFKKQYHKKVIIVGEDMLTSGAYYVAVAGDKIYVNPNTLTGSIGVVVKGFGFVDLMKKMGVERRVYVAGDDKDRLDPFLPQSKQDLAKIHDVMSEVHQNFAQAVMEGRKGKLHGDPKSLFTGDFWSGQAAVKLGLVDDLGNLMDAMEKEFKTTRYKEYGGSPNFFKILSGQISSAVDAVAFS
jgi:protease-4